MTLTKTISQSKLLLIISNLLPILGVLFLHWNIGNIILVYWLENIIIGIFNVLKLISCPIKHETDQVVADQTLKTALIIFFIVHYGLFCYVHGLVLNLIFNIAYGSMTMWSIAITVASLFISHGLSYNQNFLRQKEYVKTTVQTQMFAPYKRIVIVHLVIITGGTITLILGTPITALLALVFIKTGFDLYEHRKEHRRWQIK